MLFIININHICHASKLFDFGIYTDHTTLTEIVMGNSVDLNADTIINKELSLVNTWLKLNKLTLKIKSKKS